MCVCVRHEDAKKIVEGRTLRGRTSTRARGDDAIVRLANQTFGRHPTIFRALPVHLLRSYNTVARHPRSFALSVHPPPTYQMQKSTWFCPNNRNPTAAELDTRTPRCLDYMAKTTVDDAVEGMRLLNMCESTCNESMASGLQAAVFGRAGSKDGQYAECLLEGMVDVVGKKRCSNHAGPLFAQRASTAVDSTTTTLSAYIVHHPSWEHPTEQHPLYTSPPSCCQACCRPASWISWVDRHVAPLA